MAGFTCQMIQEKDTRIARQKFRPVLTSPTFWAGCLAIAVALLPYSYLLLATAHEAVVGDYQGVGQLGSVSIHVGLNSLTITAWTTVLSVFLGCVLAHILMLFDRRMFAFLFVAMLTPIFVNQVARNASWMWLLDASGPLNKALTLLTGRSSPLEILYQRLGVVIVLVHGMTPIAFLVCLASLQVLDEDALYAARTCGAGPVRVFLTVYLPMISPGIIASFALVSILTLGYYITPAMLGGRDGIMIAKLIEQLLNKVGDEFGASVLALFLGVIAVPLAVLFTRSLNAFYGVAHAGKQ